MRLNVTFQKKSNPFSVVLSERQQFPAALEENSTRFEPAFGEIQKSTEYIGEEVYVGEYDMTPKASEQTLPTAGKAMVKDVTVNAIPYVRVTNPGGGSTVIIARED